MTKTINRLIIRRKSIKVSKEEFFIDNGEEKIMAAILLEKKKKQKKYDNSPFLSGDDADVGSVDGTESVKVNLDEKQEDIDIVAIDEELNNTMVVEDIPIETVHEAKTVEPPIDMQEEPENDNIDDNKEEVIEVEDKPPKQPEYDFSKLAESEYNKGFEAGKKSAMEMMENEFKKKLFSSVKGLFTLTENMRKEFNEYKSTMDNHIITVALAIASKVIKQEVSIKNEAIISQLKAAINKIIGVNSFVVYINPKDEEILRLYKNDIINKFDSLKDFTIQVNEKIGVGGCKLESQVGNVDAKIESQLSVIEEALRENMKSNNYDTETKNRE